MKKTKTIELKGDILTIKKNIFTRWYMIVFYCFIGFMFLTLLTTTSEDKNYNSSDIEYDNNEYTIVISGGKTVRYSGSIGNYDSTRTIRGKTTGLDNVEMYTVYGQSATAVIQKLQGGGTLNVGIIHNGEFVNVQSTTAPYGVVSLRS